MGDVELCCIGCRVSRDQVVEASARCRHVVSMHAAQTPRKVNAQRVLSLTFLHPLYHRENYLRGINQSR